MTARTSLERQWAALIVRRPSARHILLKYLRAYGIEGHWVRFDDPQAALMVRAVQLLTYRNWTVTAADVAAYLARHDFNLTADEAAAFIDTALSDLPADVDADRLALALLAAMGIRFPEHDIRDYLRDPLGLRAERMQARKARAHR